jgi:hypothetical protein
VGLIDSMMNLKIDGQEMCWRMTPNTSFVLLGNTSKYVHRVAHSPNLPSKLCAVFMVLFFC